MQQTKSKGFKGDSPSKKIVRFEVWDYISNEITIRTSPKVLVLAGPEGSDVGVATQLGIDVKSITAVDTNKKCVTATKWRYPEARVLHSDILEVVGKESFDFVFLDLCGPITNESLTIATSVADSLKRSSGYLAFTFLCGRENPKSDTSKLIAKTRAELNRSEKKVKLAQISRATAVQQELLKRMRKLNCVVVPLKFWFYQSTNSFQPFGVYVCQILRTNKATRDVSNDIANKANPEFSFVKDSFLPKTAVGVIARNLDPQMTLNASKGSVAAWKAHATRGTYA